MSSTDVVDALRLWRDGLINLSGNNRALNFRPTKTGSVLFEQPSMSDILAGLRQGGLWSLRGQFDDGEADDAFEGRPALGLRELVSDRPQEEVEKAVRNLARRAQAEFLDRGLSVLYVALGALRWSDVDDTGYLSPLLLVPVELVRTKPKELPLLQIGEEETLLNPALALRLEEFGIQLPGLGDLTEVSVDDALAAVGAAVTDRRSWGVVPFAALSAFTFQKEAMYRDLKNNEAAVTAHPHAQALANQDPTSQPPERVFEPLTPGDVDQKAPPEDLPLVLDADSSQCACIAAALQGKSFVMDGPPGTGKSQTIANMIGALLHAGKSVLFVSEKAAALEVVQNRLDHAGLGAYILALHSHKATRKEVASKLLEALETVPRPPADMDSSDRRRVRQHRASLTAYANAMNAVRQPIGYSLHDILGRLAELEEFRSAPLPLVPMRNLTREAVNEADLLAKRLGSAWRPGREGDSFLWRGIVERGSLDLRLSQAQEALEELAGALSPHQVVNGAFDLQSVLDVERLMLLLDLAARRPAAVRDGWLLAGNLAEIRAAYARWCDARARDHAASDAVISRSGVSWRDLPNPEELPPSPSGGSPSAPLMWADLDAESLATLGQHLGESTDLLVRWRRGIDGIADSLGLPRASRQHEVDMVLEIAGSTYSPTRPISAWLLGNGLASAQDAYAELRAASERLDAAEAAGHRYFTDAALKQPLEELYERFNTVHHGLRKLLSAYRQDREIVRAIKSEVATLKDAIADLKTAVAWSKATETFIEAERRDAAALGPFWQGRKTDFGALADALYMAARLREIVPSESMPAVARQMSGAGGASGLRAVAEAVQHDVRRWRDTLLAGQLAGAVPELLTFDLDTTHRWFESHRPIIEAAHAWTTAVARSVARRVVLADACATLDLRDAAAEAWKARLRVVDEVSAILGTDPADDSSVGDSDIGDAITWAEQLRSIRNQTDAPLTQGQIDAFAAAGPNLGLASAHRRWLDARERVLGAFRETRRVELLVEMDSIQTATSFIDDLRTDSAGQDQWFAYLDARHGLDRFGLQPAIDYCVRNRVEATEVPGILRRALLRGWVDDVFAHDDALTPWRTEDRDELVADFRRLDRELIQAATSKIITAVNSRRPTRSDSGEPALIRREGLKKRRHRPIRELLGMARATVLKLKPCFMMSPLAVSQYLPSDMIFDVVVFDEASQVTPGDAVNCIYRGKTLITAGDDRQLPPTSFFDRMTEGDDDATTDVSDFQSVLELSKASGGFTNLGLRWHYRSKHEALIAFSNQKFYDGKLVTYPGALSVGPDIGVELFTVQGVYRRGTTRDNPVEADAVAERVLHHFGTRPDATLGVVCFSIAQVDAIEDALRRAVERRPDLESHLAGDRLTGMFVKSLESVQGDERDVMIFSIGYGPDENGKITANFGALNKPKGWRRLNVAITRARQRVEIVASMRAGDMPHSDNESVRHLISYLDYAERGLPALALEVGETGRGTDSPFEDSVLGTIRSYGYEVEPQVGAAGYRIDLGVRHPELPGVYALGVECDGYAYHSSPAARDRDRLRQDVLQGLGWRLHRIWGTSWYRSRAQEEERLRKAIDAAVVAPVRGRLVGKSEWLKRDRVELDVAQVEDVSSWAVPYVQAPVGPLPRWTDPSEPGAWYHMIEPIEQVAEREGPLHTDLLIQRLREGWGIGRVGHKIRSNIDEALRRAAVDVSGDFVDAHGRTEFAVRVPASDHNPRPVAHVADQELNLALVHLLQSAGGMSTDELVTACARVFGWTRVGSDIRARLSTLIAEMIQSGHVGVIDGVLRVRE